MPLPFGTVNLEIPNTLISFPLNNLSTYKLLFPASNFATPALSIVGTTVNEDHKVLLTAIIDTSQMFTSKWFSPLNVLLSTTNEVFLHNPASGNYTYELTLASGCVITDTITI